MSRSPLTQEARAVELLDAHGLLRLSEFVAAGVTAATVSRMEAKGAVTQLCRGLYQLPDAPMDVHHSMAEAAKLVPNGVLCLDSALAFHELTDRIPAAVWMAIGQRDWRPTITQPRIEIVRHGPKLIDSGVVETKIGKVPVRVYAPAKTVVDFFYHGRRIKNLYQSEVTLSDGVAAMKATLRQRKATPAEIELHARNVGIWEKVVRQPLEALTIDA